MSDDKLRTETARLETSQLVDSAVRIAGFDLGKRPTFGAAANVSGIRTSTQTFSLRRDSRTIFAVDNRYGHLGTAGAWTGSDRAAIAACRRVLRAARIPAAEIGEIDVVSEFGTVAERISEKEIRIEEPEILRKLARARRAVERVPVWSSHVVVGLTRDGQIGRLELHWPHVAPEVMKEAQILQAFVLRGFEAPKMPGATLESIEAGIIHSPAVGFFMDVMATIRAVYVGDDPMVGRKPTFYLDRHGELVALPRDIQRVKRDKTERAAPR